jgi:hypothetical protein
MTRVALTSREELDEKINAQAADEDRHVHIHSVMLRLTDYRASSAAPAKKANWAADNPSDSSAD